MSDPLDILADAAEERERELYTSGGDKLDKIGKAGAEIQALEAEVQRLEAAIADRKARIQELATRILPDLLRSVGMNSFVLQDGTNVGLKDELFPDIPAAKRDEAYAWLRENGHGDLNKHEIKISFGMGEDMDALALRRMLHDHNSPLNFTEKETILPQSLRAWVREQERKGRELPEEFFSVHRITKAELKKR